MPNPLNRYLAKLQYGADGSLTLYFADQKPADALAANWLPTGEPSAAFLVAGAGGLLFVLRRRLG